MSRESAFDFFAARPRPPLAAFVESIWAVRGTSGYQRFTMLPTGAVQLMINFGAAHRVLASGGRSRQAEFRNAWVAGLQHGPLAIASPPESDLLAIRFRPGGAHAFQRTPLHAVTDDVVDAEELFGPDVRSLREELALAASRPAQLQVAERWLLQRLRPNEADLACVVRALETLSQRRPGPVGVACERLGLSNTRMIRIFRRLCGLTPKTLAGVQRFHLGLSLLAQGRLAHVEIALRLGYYDQPHFNREFRRLAGTSPGDFVLRRGADNESLIDG